MEKKYTSVNKLEYMNLISLGYFSLYYMISNYLLAMSSKLSQGIVMLRSYHLIIRHYQVTKVWLLNKDSSKQLTTSNQPLTQVMRH